MTDTTTDDLELRLADESDGDAIGTLFSNSPDGGAISFVPRFESNPYVAYAALRPETTGFVAETPDGDVAGVGFVSFTEARFGGTLRPAALLNALAVHPDYRGHGLAKRLCQRRIGYARDALGEDAVVFANIQSGNDPSRAVADSWAETFTHDFLMYPTEPRSSATEPDGYEVRDATPDEYEAVAEGANAFYATEEVYRPYDAEGLGHRLADAPLEEPLHRYVVAVSEGEVLAGGFVTEMHRAMSLVVHSVAPELEAADELPSTVPESREIRMKLLADCWYAPGEEAAVRALWETVRAEDTGENRITLNYDPDGPLGDVLGLEPEGGAMGLSMAVSGPTDDGPIAPLF